MKATRARWKRLGWMAWCVAGCVAVSSAKGRGVAGGGVADAVSPEDEAYARAVARLNHPVPAERLEAVNALTREPVRADVGSVLRSKLNDPDTAVRLAVAGFMIRREPPSSAWLEAVVPGLTAEGSGLRERASELVLTGLKHPGLAAALPPASRSAAASALTTLLRDPQPVLREQGLLGLDRLGEIIPVSRLSLLAKDAVSGVRVQVLRYVTGHPDARTAPLAVAALQDADPGVRRQAVQAIASTRPPRMRHLLQGMLKDPDLGVVTETIQVAPETGAEGVHVLREALRHPKGWIRQETAQALGRCNDPEAVACLTALLTDPSPNVKLEAVKALGASPAPSALIRLTLALRDPLPAVRLEACSALAEHAITATWLPFLEAAVTDVDADVKRASLAVLDQVGPDALGIWINLLDHEEFELRSHAVERVKSFLAVRPEVVKRGLNHPRPAVRQRLADLLQR